MHNIESLLRNNDPGAKVPDYSDDQARGMLSRAVMPAHPRRRRGWRVAAVAAATLTVIGVGASSLATPSISAHAEEILTEAAINAVDPVAEPGQYWELTDSGTAGDPHDECVDSSIERTYVAVDGNRPSWYWSVNTAPAHCRARVPENQEQVAWRWATSPNEMADSWRWPSPKFLAGLPRDPDALRQLMYADAAHPAHASRDSGIYSLAYSLLTSGVAPADLRSALFEVLKELPEIEVVDKVVVDGREAVVFAFEGQDATEQMIIDPSIGEMVGFRVDISEDNQREGTYTRRVVDSVPEEAQRIATVSTCTIREDRTLVGDEQLSCQ